MRLRTKALIMAAGAAAALAFQPILATAQEQHEQQNAPCAQRNNIVNTLDAQYKETPRAIGLVSKEAVLEVFVSESGSWTLVVTNPEGLSCVLAAGQSWEEIPTTSRLPGA